MSFVSVQWSLPCVTLIGRLHIAVLLVSIFYYLCQPANITKSKVDDRFLVSFQILVFSRLPFVCPDPKENPQKQTSRWVTFLLFSSVRNSSFPDFVPLPFIRDNLCLIIPLFWVITLYLQLLCCHCCFNSLLLTPAWEKGPVQLSQTSRNFPKDTMCTFSEITFLFWRPNEPWPLWSCPPSTTTPITRLWWLSVIEVKVQATVPVRAAVWRWDLYAFWKEVQCQRPPITTNCTTGSLEKWFRYQVFIFEGDIWKWSWSL